MCAQNAGANLGAHGGTATSGAFQYRTLWDCSRNEHSDCAAWPAIHGSIERNAASQWDAAVRTIRSGLQWNSAGDSQALTPLLRGLKVGLLDSLFRPIQLRGRSGLARAPHADDPADVPPSGISQPRTISQARLDGAQWPAGPNGAPQPVMPPRRQFDFLYSMRRTLRAQSSPNPSASAAIRCRAWAALTSIIRNKPIRLRMLSPRRVNCLRVLLHHNRHLLSSTSNT